MQSFMIPGCHFLLNCLSGCLDSCTPNACGDLFVFSISLIKWDKIMGFFVALETFSVQKTCCSNDQVAHSNGVQAGGHGLCLSSPAGEGIFHRI